MCRSSEEYPPNGKRCLNRGSKQHQQEKRDAYNKRRREIYHAKKATAANGTPTSLPAPLPLSSVITDGSPVGNSMQLMRYMETEKPVQHPELGLTTVTAEGSLVDVNYFAGTQVQGTIDWRNLDEDSAENVFGFKEVEGEHGEYVSSWEDDREVHLEEEEFKSLSAQEMEHTTPEEKAALKMYTSGEYETLNSALNRGLGRLKETDRDHSRGERFFSGERLDISKTRNWHKEVVWSKEMMEETCELLDSALAKGPKTQRILYRGVNIGSSMFNNYRSGENDLEAPGKWVDDNAQLGQELKFNGYQSASPSIMAAEEFTQTEGVYFEILTPEGINISAVSEMPEEKEVLLPRDSRYMVVGVKKNVNLEYSKEMLGDDSQGCHVVQLVAINNEGEILTGNNASPKKNIWEHESKA